MQRIRDALGWAAGSILGVAAIAALIVLPVFVVVRIGSALGVPWAIAVQFRIILWLEARLTDATALMPAWAWVGVLALLWLAFLDVHVRWLVRDELAKHLNERRGP